MFRMLFKPLIVLHGCLWVSLDFWVVRLHCVVVGSHHVLISVHIFSVRLVILGCGVYRVICALQL